MNKALKALIMHMLNNRIIGEKHVPEDRVIKPRIKYLNRHDQTEFQTEYSGMIMQGYFIRRKKRTGKSSDYHISLMPGDVLAELKKMIE
jgi:hypothetical protein